ncbi:hypothetical protein BT69DRAFT_1341123 [Atractiella rhizophila]|nr:hypothetical protein BT69DRAFT_1341123 [Atractiella rhizophila]
MPILVRKASLGRYLADLLAQILVNGNITVVYALMMSTTSFRDAKIVRVIKFESWTASCNSSFVGTTGYPVLRFPLTIPSTTVIPPWALINNIGGIWTESQAYDNATATTTASGTPSNTSPSDDNGKKSSTPVGAIVGGVIGGVAVLAAIGVAFFFLRRRSNAKQEPRQLKPQMGQVNAFNPSTAPSLNSSPFTPPPASEASYPSRFYPGSPPARTAYTTQHSSHGHSHSHESQPMLGPGGIRQGSPDIDASGRVIPEIQSEDLAMPDTYESYGRR